jgi:hypothetical protein
MWEFHVSTSALIAAQNRNLKGMSQRVRVSGRHICSPICRLLCRLVESFL